MRTRNINICEQVMSMFVLFIILWTRSTSMIIHFHEELRPNTLLISSISSASDLQWFPSSLMFQPYFTVTKNHSLYTNENQLDREEFCRRNQCNCSACWFALKFFEQWTNGSVSIGTIDVLLEDINDHSPTFKQSMVRLSLAENLPVGYEIPLQSAVDDDEGLLSVQTYQLYPMLNNPFRLIFNSKPILQLTESLDRETKSIYQLRLIAYDGGQPALSGEQSIEILLTDVNDNPPQFNQSIYRLSIPENQTIDSTLLRVIATDRDEGENSRLDYSIDDPSSKFHIDHQSGEIFLRNPLDYELRRSYTLTITVHDHGQPQLKNYATVMIDVTDVNDHRPNILVNTINETFLHQHQKDIKISECTLKGVTLLNIYVVDEDAGDNARVHCHLNDTRLILIPLTTNIYSLQSNPLSSFDYETQPKVKILLQCSDFGQPSLSNSLVFNVEVEDCNDHPPSILLFNQPSLIPYNTIEFPSIITKLIVDDGDRSRANVFYFIWNVEPWLNLTVTSNGTVVLHSRPIDPGLFTVNVTVIDEGNLSTTISFTIEIFSVENRSLWLIFSLFVLIFFTSIFIGVVSLCRWKSTSSSSSRTTIDFLQPTFTNEVRQWTPPTTHNWTYSEKVLEYLGQLAANRHSWDSIDV